MVLINIICLNSFQKTDQLIQSTLREKFSDCTVLTIAHRINTIIDSDRVMVMDSGKLIEFAHPAVLLENPDSIFYDLVRETGMFDVLVEQANVSLRSKNKSPCDSGEKSDVMPRLDSDAFSEVQL